MISIEKVLQIEKYSIKKELYLSKIFQIIVLYVFSMKGIIFMYSLAHLG